ncbi:multiple sugar transport system substrate-binding protein [Catenuloplanes nepalensis]|uniref:Multiple sugar transport system substrate-binding protein n=1 Tax=Catenuloplanes nepalensis TaxID=587533 RepID=A0ABT9MTD0_9ACTN|nr:extracellular solute-binding protein [Catenuloplanes nepalensis]MDP9794678.1 multiple sugar transport system substrate-binding protein [Catenuloplanes nepalensis]
MTMRRYVAILLAVALTAGCGGGAADDDGGGELVFANWQWLEPGRGEALWTAVNGYTTADPAVTLKQQAIARKDYESTLKTQIGARGGPDLLIIPDTFLPELAEAGALEPLDDVLDDAGKAALNATNDAGVLDGEQVGYAWEIVNYALFWNTKVLDQAGVQPPTDFPGLVTAAKTIKDKTGNPGFAVRHQINEEAPWWIDFSNWSYGFGGAWSKDGALTIDAPGNVAAVTAFRDMYTSGAMAVGDDASTFRSKFKAGTVGMMIDNSSALATMVAGNTVVPSTGVGASPLPFPAKASGQAGFFIGINAFSKNKTAAKKWLRWFYGAGPQKQAAAALGASVLGTDTTPPAEFVTANPWVPTFQAQAALSADAVIDGFETETPQIRHIVLTEVEKVLVDGEDPAVALARAQEAAEKLR